MHARPRQRIFLENVVWASTVEDFVAFIVQLYVFLLFSLEMLTVVRDLLEETDAAFDDEL